MGQDKRFLVDVGINNLPYPIVVNSRVDPLGQATVAVIGIQTRIMQEFEALWIDKFIHILHDHKGRVGTDTLKVNILDYLQELKASYAKVTFEYPFFMEKTAPVSKEGNLVCYNCTYTVETNSLNDAPKASIRIHIPVITTYPTSSNETPSSLFGQLSVVDIEVESDDKMNPEDIIDLVDRHALTPTYSYLSQEDQQHLIQKIHSEEKYSVVMVDEIKKELARRNEITSSSIRCINHGMLHSFNTMISTEKSRGVPFSGISDDF